MIDLHVFPTLRHARQEFERRGVHITDPDALREPFIILALAQVPARIRGLRLGDVFAHLVLGNRDYAAIRSRQAGPLCRFLTPLDAEFEGAITASFDRLKDGAVIRLNRLAQGPGL